MSCYSDVEYQNVNANPYFNDIKIDVE